MENRNEPSNKGKSRIRSCQREEKSGVVSGGGNALARERLCVGKGKGSCSDDRECNSRRCLE